MERKFLIRGAMEYIENHLDENIGLDVLAERACLSKYHFHRMFRQAAGKPVSRYIREKRMDRAANELAKTGRPIVEIALDCRYSSQEAFSRAFRRIYAISPGRYRRLAAGGRLFHGSHSTFDLAA